MKISKSDSTTGERVYNLYEAFEPTDIEQKIYYNRMRAERRTRSKATVIGLFSNAKKNLWELRTISGLEDEYGFFEIYRDSFCDALTSLKVTSDDDYSRLLSHMNGYSHIGAFLYDEKEQIAELAAFGLILYERIALAKTNTISHVELFLLHESLHECLAYIKDGDSLSMRARGAATARHAEHRSMKADVFTWLDSQPKFKSIEDAATAIMKQQPIKHVTGRDWFKEWKKLRSAGTP